MDGFSRQTRRPERQPLARSNQPPVGISYSPESGVPYPCVRDVRSGFCQIGSVTVIGPRDDTGRRRPRVSARLRWYATLLFSKKVVYFLEYPALHSIRELPPDPSTAICRLRESDVVDFLALSRQYNPDTFRTSDDVTSALDRGHRCYLARNGPEILGFLWIAVREVNSPDLYCRFLLEADQIVAYHNFVRPDTRGRNLAPRLQAFALREAANDGYRRCYGYVLSTNEASIRSTRKLSARRVGSVVCGFVLGRYFFRVRTVEGFRVRAEVIGGPWFAWKRSLAKRGLGKAWNDRRY
jgi:GNAT superfamily N-acetyltransferase